MMKILILGGTSEANQLAEYLAANQISAIFSYAGRVAKPKPQPVPVRIGGFGGIEGLMAFITQNQITHLIDCTHPFAANMSRNAHAAAHATGIRLLSFTRQPWQATAADNWHCVADYQQAVAYLEAADMGSKRILLAIGRIHLDAFSHLDQHFFLLRFIEPPTSAITFKNYDYRVAKGPFNLSNEIELLKAQRIDMVVSKNAGGQAAVAKIIAARELGLPVLMITRPGNPIANQAYDLDSVVQWLSNHQPTTALGV